jgi:hypothetical protein
MSKKAVFKSKALPRIKDTSKTVPRVDPDQVARSLGAKKKGRLSSGGSPVSQNATRLMAATKGKDSSIAAQSSVNASPVGREYGQLDETDKRRLQEFIKAQGITEREAAARPELRIIYPFTVGLSGTGRDESEEGETRKVG